MIRVTGRVIPPRASDAYARFAQFIQHPGDVRRALHVQRNRDFATIGRKAVDLVDTEAVFRGLAPGGEDILCTKPEPYLQLGHRVPLLAELYQLGQLVIDDDFREYPHDDSAGKLTQAMFALIGASFATYGKRALYAFIDDCWGLILEAADGRDPELELRYEVQKRALGPVQLNVDCVPDPDRPVYRATALLPALEDRWAETATALTREEATHEAAQKLLTTLREERVGADTRVLTPARRAEIIRLERREHRHQRRSTVR